MITVLLTLILLSVLFTASSGIVLLLRRVWKGGAGALLYRVWLAVLLLSLLPLRVTSPVIGFREAQPVGTLFRAESYPETAVSETIKGAESVWEESDLGFRGETEEFPAWFAVTPSEDGGKTYTVALSRSVTLIGTALLAVWFAGFLYRLGTGLWEYRQVNALLRAYSAPCRDTELLSLFSACGTTAGVRRPVQLRFVDAEYPVSPCVSGWLRPTVYIGEGCQTLSRETLSWVFLHEMCHIRRADCVYKLFLLLVLSVHWWNPLGETVLHAVCADAELACDTTVLRVAGKTSAVPYMDSVLTVAAHLRTNFRVPSAAIPDSALFFAKETKPNDLKRRYYHMKNEKRGTTAVQNAVCALLVAVLLCANLILLSSCGYAEADRTAGFAPADGEANVWRYDPLDNALHNYFGVPQGEPISAEQLASITSIDVSYGNAGSLYANAEQLPAALYGENADTKIPYFSFNGDPVVQLAPGIVRAELWDRMFDAVLAAGGTSLEALGGWEGFLTVNCKILEDGTVQVSVPNTGTMEGQTFARQVLNARKLAAFYCLKDPADPELEEEEVLKMLMVFPMAKDGAIYLYDPFSTPREDQVIYWILAAAGITPAETVTEEDIRASVEAYEGLSDPVLTFSDIPGYVPQYHKTHEPEIG